MNGRKIKCKTEENANIIEEARAADTMYWDSQVTLGKQKRRVHTSHRSKTHRERGEGPSRSAVELGMKRKGQDPD